MKQTNKRYILMRYSMVVGLMLLFSAAIVWSMFKTTVIYADAWNLKADSILMRTAPIEPERGKLLADNGTVLAANLQFYTPRIDWRAPGIKEDTLMKYLPALCDSLAAFEPSRTAEQWKETLLEARQRVLDGKGNRAYRLFRRTLSHGEYARVKSFPFFRLNKNKSGFYCEQEDKRTKPYGTMASRSIGTVGPSADRQGQHGRSGLEMALDSLLYGKEGVARRIQLTSNIVNAESTPAIKGYDITTTINVALQDIVETELYNMCHETECRWGTAVLMEVKTGEIKAISNLEWSNTFGDYVEGRNNAVLGYEPGSVMKPITMMVALEDGTVTDIDAPMMTGTTFSYGGRLITDPHGGAYLTPREIIATSSNVGMSRIVLKKYEKDPDKFRQRLAEMGFFEPFHSGIGGETTPVIQKLGHTNADRVALTRMAFGYSTMIPPLSTLAMYNAIANDGKYVRPHLVKKLSREGEPDSIVPISYIRRQVCSPQNAQKLRIMLHDVVWSNRGTARRWVQDDKVEIAGKTGTAFTIENGQYTSQRRFAFCGFFPYEQPRYSCIVLMLGANRGAAASSGMVMRNVARKMYARGLLGDAPTYANTSGKEPADSRPTLYATSKGSQDAYIKKSIGARAVKVFEKPAQPARGVPNVKGLGIREAIARLENAGLCVRFNGTGYVVAQSLPAGSEYQRGQVINLQLRL